MVCQQNRDFGKSGCQQKRDDRVTKDAPYINYHSSTADLTIEVLMHIVRHWRAHPDGKPNLFQDPGFMYLTLITNYRLRMIRTQPMYSASSKPKNLYHPPRPTLYQNLQLVGTTPRSTARGSCQTVY